LYAGAGNERIDAVVAQDLVEVGVSENEAGIGSGSMILTDAEDAQDVVEVGVSEKSAGSGSTSMILTNAKDVTYLLCLGKIFNQCNLGHIWLFMADRAMPNCSGKIHKSGNMSRLTPVLFILLGFPKPSFVYKPLSEG
jgi:hypothetical protein